MLYSISCMSLEVKQKMFGVMHYATYQKIAKLMQNSVEGHLMH